MLLRQLPTLVGCAILCGCIGARSAADAVSPKSPPRTPPAAPKLTEREVLLRSARAAWSQRADKDALQAAIDDWQRALEVDARDAETWIHLSQALFFFAELSLMRDSGCPARRPQTADEPESVSRDSVEAAETGSPNSAADATAVQGEVDNAKCASNSAHGDKTLDVVLQTLTQATQAAESALRVMTAGARQPKAGHAEEGQGGFHLGKRAVPALYWKARSLHLWSSLTGYFELLANQDEVRELMAHCLREDPEYFYAGPHRFFGTYYARPLSFAEKNLAQSKRHFERAAKIAPEFFGTYVAYARDYAVMAQDRQIFEKQLGYVLATHLDRSSEAAPENQLERYRAEQLLHQASHLFE